MSKCVFPDSLKFAEVSSLFKKKYALIKTNYRPVSILVALSKIYEKAVGVQLTDYFNAIFSTLLSAFRKGYSCQSALLNMLEEFKSSLDKGEFVACISMDISKVFDCLPHCLTIYKLFAYGLSREACTLVASYLFQRKQRVKIGNIKSEWGGINKGVPQGSIMGPLIFDIFLNDLFHFVKEGNMYNNADDNSISVSNKELTNLSLQLPRPRSRFSGSSIMLWKQTLLNFRVCYWNVTNKPASSVCQYEVKILNSQNLFLPLASVLMKISHLTNT